MIRVKSRAIWRTLSVPRHAALNSQNSISERRICAHAHAASWCVHIKFWTSRAVTHSHVLSRCAIAHYQDWMEILTYGALPSYLKYTHSPPVGRFV